MSEKSAERQPVKRLRRAERREQILASATRAFARGGGFTATSLDDIAAEAGISRVIIYRHFDSKADMYQAVLDRARAHLAETLGVDQFGGESIPALVQAAASQPDGFRLLFRYTAREPQFREVVDSFMEASIEIAYRYLAPRIPDPDWAAWAARLVPTVTIEAVIAWLDCGAPGLDQAAARIASTVQGVIHAAAAKNEDELGPQRRMRQHAKNLG